MQYLTLLSTFAVIQGALAGGVSVFTGPNCTGKQTNVHFDSNSIVPSIPAFESYRENGYGAHGQRIQFWTQPGTGQQCGGEYLYDTWAYGGDYFQSRTCYDVGAHPDSRWLKARCIKTVAA
ncbi:hypothetical protein ASPVEDRAFT_28664 [Aspergillus versicolor CBS 583.65]|uniref:AA1-like domain-containing protein n=1 Tax=Aspergillus versicolor CBS 583.65 TaxID=1036611 RepID=A0A1L9PKI7_ASPVE|nr:uncharacterized protein ASPVEDRAFT_28664 [Aspergillus versicolor CBS 583.65]OJJ02040.1 hypothetical protein ASPVEDRAFT_28664 [Aspergillus versicolor CBS 583.65]